MSLTRQLVFQAGNAGWWYAACTVVTVAVVFAIYRYERQLVPMAVGLSLLALRLVAVALAFLTLLEPVLAWRKERDRSGRIIVAVDASDSMRLTDPQASDAEKLRWAQAAGMIGNPAIRDRLEQWLSALEQGEEPEWVAPNETTDAAKRDRLAQTRRENLRSLLEQVDRLPRSELALHLLSGTRAPLLKSLQEIGQVQLHVFAGKAEPAEESSLSQTLAQPPATLSPTISDLSQGLNPGGAGGGEGPPLAVVLLTDGRDTLVEAQANRGRQWDQFAAPVYPIMLGSSVAPKDLAVRKVDVPQTVFRRDKAVAQVTLHAAGFQGEELEVLLETDGQEPVRKKVKPRDELLQVDFELDAAQVGRRPYTVRLPVLEGETRKDNNSQSFVINVVDDKAHVLLVEGEARWEFRFVDNAYRRDPRVELQQVVFDQPFLRLLEDTYFPRELKLPPQAVPGAVPGPVPGAVPRPAPVKPGEDRKPLPGLEQSPFAEADVVILGDVAPAQMPAVVWELLERFVSESGGTLVFSSGKRYLPERHANPLLKQLLPVTTWRTVLPQGPREAGSPSERGFHLRLTPDGEREPMFQFEVEPAANRTIWQNLPGHPWGLFGEAKPGANVWVTGQLSEGDKTLQDERQSAVIVQQQYGLGQVVWLGIDSTWRWRHRVGDKYHQRFWGQLARWAATSKTAAGNENVRFGSEKTDVAEGEEVLLRARWTAQFLARHPQLQGVAEVYRAEDPPGKKPFSTLPLKAAEGRPLVHEGRLLSLPPGEYRAKLVVPGVDLGQAEMITSIYVHPRRNVELSDVTANPALLEQLASVSRGKLLRPEEAHQLPQLLVPDLHSLVLREEYALWDHWITLLLFFAVLTSEWVLRKLNGLP